MITFETNTADGPGWSRVWHNIIRDGNDTGMTAFEHDNGTISVELDDSFLGEFTSLDQVKAWVARRVPTFTERLIAQGIIK